MGASGSSPPGPAAALLDRFTSREELGSDERFWPALLAARAPAATSDELAALARRYGSELLRNNAKTANFQALVLRMTQSLARAGADDSTATVVQQACSAVFFTRVFFKHMVETLEPEVSARIRAHYCVVASWLSGEVLESAVLAHNSLVRRSVLLGFAVPPSAADIRSNRRTVHGDWPCANGS
eukprot:scaffold65389_cov35-Tisochrysis_lutea.AAC.3